MNYGNIIYYDTANCHGLSTTLFVSGCEHHCHNCHNLKTWDFNYGSLFTEEAFNKIDNSFNNIVKKFVISGGDPLHPNHRYEIQDICRRLKIKHPDLTIIIYTGYALEELPSTFIKEITPFIDYLIDGRFEENNRPEKLQLRGSLNQRCWHFSTKDGKHFIDDVTNEYF